MKKRLAVILIVFFSVMMLLSAADNTQHYDTISLYLHGRAGVDAAVNKISSHKDSAFDREGVMLKLGVDMYKNEDIDGFYGYTFGLDFDYPFHTKNNTEGYPSSLPYLALNGGLVLRARPWDYIDFNITGRMNLSTHDYKSLELGFSVEIGSDIYLSDYVYLKSGLEYGAGVTRFLFNNSKNYLDTSFSLASFSFTIGAGFAFGGYSE